MHACLLHHLTTLMTDYEFGTKKKGKRKKKKGRKGRKRKGQHI